MVLCNASFMLKAQELVYSQISFKIWLPKANSPAVIVQNPCASLRDVYGTLNCKLTANSGTTWLHLCWPWCTKTRNTLKVFVLPVLALAIYPVASWKSYGLWANLQSLLIWTFFLRVELSKGRLLINQNPQEASFGTWQPGGFATFLDRMYGRPRTCSLCHRLVLSRTISMNLLSWPSLKVASSLCLNLHPPKVLLSLCAINITSDCRFFCAGPALFLFWFSWDIIQKFLPFLKENTTAQTSI